MATTIPSLNSTPLAHSGDGDASWGPDAAPDLGKLALYVGAFAGLTLYLAVASVATIIFPPTMIAFAAPLALIALAATPQGKAAPLRLAVTLVIVGTALLPVWPIYIHLKLGPLPIITPARVLLYAVTALWAIDMISSPLRRAQLIAGLRAGGLVTWFALGMLALALFSLPLGQGRIAATTFTIRQVIIWFIPFCIAVTYIRNDRDFFRLIIALVCGAVLTSLIAINETLSEQLLAGTLAPLINTGAEWLQLAQQQKIRDGVFRAQATHTHPLSLGEYIALMAPFTLMLVFKSKTLIGRTSWTLALAILFGGALATNSRGALLAIAISTVIAFVLVLRRMMRRRIGSRLAPVVGLIMFALIAGSPAGAFIAQKMVSGAGKTSAANSTQSRIDQIEKAWPKILKRPVGGYGAGRGARVLGYWGRTLTIDNYYLSLALDYGFPGPIVFAALLSAVAMTAYRRSRDGRARGPKALSANENEVLYVGLVAAIAAFAVTRTITSLGSNLAFMYIVFGAIAGAGVARRRQFKNATRPPRTRVLF